MPGRSGGSGSCGNLDGVDLGTALARIREIAGRMLPEGFTTALAGELTALPQPGAEFDKAQAEPPADPGSVAH